MVSLIILTIFILIGAAFCSGSEAAVFSASKIKLQTMVKHGDMSAKNLLHLKDNMSGSIGTLVIMNNLFNIVGSILVGVVTSDIFDHLWIGIFSSIFTFLVILFGEVLPKNYGEKNALALGIFVAPLVILFSRLFYPILFLLEKLSEAMFGKDKKHHVSEDEIRFMADLGAREQSIEQDEETLIQNVFKMNDKTANDILTPRVNIDALDSKLSLEVQKEYIYITLLTVD